MCVWLCGCDRERRWRGMSDSGVKLRHVTATASDESLAMIRSPHHGANANHPNSSQKQKRLEPI